MSDSHDDPWGMVEMIVDHCSDKLTPWESDFIQDIQFQLESDRDLTDGQYEKLIEIFDKVTR